MEGEHIYISSQLRPLVFYGSRLLQRNCNQFSASALSGEPLAPNSR